MAILGFSWGGFGEKNERNPAQTKSRYNTLLKLDPENETLTKRRCSIIHFHFQLLIHVLIPASFLFGKSSSFLFQLLFPFKFRAFFPKTSETGKGYQATPDDEPSWVVEPIHPNPKKTILQEKHPRCQCGWCKKTVPKTKSMTISLEISKRQSKENKNQNTNGTVTCFFVPGWYVFVFSAPPPLQKKNTNTGKPPFHRLPSI